MKINKEMADHLLRWGTEYEHSKFNKPEIRDLYILVRYIKDQLEELQATINANKSEAE